MECLLLIVNIELSIDHTSRVNNLFLHFIPDAYSHLQEKSFNKKAPFEPKPTGGLGARQFIAKSAKVQHRSFRSFSLKYQVPFIPN